MIQPTRSLRRGAYVILLSRPDRRILDVLSSSRYRSLPRALHLHRRARPRARLQHRRNAERIAAGRLVRERSAERRLLFQGRRRGQVGRRADRRRPVAARRRGMGRAVRDLRHLRRVGQQPRARHRRREAAVARARHAARRPRAHVGERDPSVQSVERLRGRRRAPLGALEPPGPEAGRARRSGRARGRRRQAARGASEPAGRAAGDAACSIGSTIRSRGAWDGCRACIRSR